MSLIVFGDSHAIIWGGGSVSTGNTASVFGNVQINYLGPALAYNLMDDSGSLGKWGQKIVGHPSLLDKETSIVMLSFGEIDCRTQVIKRAIKGGLSIKDACLIIVDRYFRFIDLLRDTTSLPIIIWGPIATGSYYNNWDPKFPNIGSEIERNIVTHEFNNLLSLGVKTRPNVYNIDILNKMINPLGQTNTELQDDGCHLNARGLGLAISAFNEVISKTSIPEHSYFELSNLFSIRKAGIYNISRHARIVSVSSDIDNLTRGSLLAEGDSDIFHTKNELGPNVLIDLGHGTFLDRIEVIVSNRDSLKSFKSLRVYVSQDREKFDLVYSHNGVALSEGASSFSFYNSESYRAIRFLRFELANENEFVLKGINLYGKTFVN